MLRSIGNVLLDSGWEIFRVCIREPGVSEFADIETALLSHRFKA